MRRKPGEGALEPEIGDRKGVRLAEPEGDVVGRPRAETVQRCDRSNQPVERDAAVEPYAVLQDGPGERPNSVGSRRHEADAFVVCAGKRRRRRERVREAQRFEARHRNTKPFHEPADDGVRRRDGNLLADDGADADLERAPRSRRPQPWTLADQRPHHRVAGEHEGRLVRVEIEVRDVPSTLYDVHELLPMGQVGVQQQMVIASRAELENAGSIAHDDRPAVRVGGDALHAGDRAAGEVVQQRRPIERAVEREPQHKTAVRDEAICPAATRPQSARRFAEDLPADAVELAQAAEASREGDLRNR